MKIRINAETMRRMLALTVPHASKDTTRAHLCGVCFRAEPEGLDVVATDGNRLALAHFEDVGEGLLQAGSLLVTLDMAKVILHALKRVRAKERPHCEIQIAGEQGGKMAWEIHGSGHENTLTGGTGDTGDEKFPPYDRVVPRECRSWKSGGPAVGINPSFLAEACKSMQLAGFGESASLRFGKDALSPVVLVSLDPIACLSATVVVMPRRVEGCASDAYAPRMIQAPRKGDGPGPVVV